MSCCQEESTTNSHRFRRGGYGWQHKRGEKLSGKVRKLFQKLSKKACICLANWLRQASHELNARAHTHAHAHVNRQANKFNHLSSGWRENVLQFCTATQDAWNGFGLRMKKKKHSRNLSVVVQRLMSVLYNYEMAEIFIYLYNILLAW